MNCPIIVNQDNTGVFMVTEAWVQGNTIQAGVLDTTDSVCVAIYQSKSKAQQALNDLIYHIAHSIPGVYRMPADESISTM